MGRKRALIFMIAPVLLIAITVLLKLEAHSSVWPPEFLGIFGYTVVVPLTALIIGTSVLGAEIDDSSVISLLATPLPRSTVVLTKLGGRDLADVLFRGREPSTWPAAIATGPGSKLAIGLLAGATLASVVYNALFVWLSVVTTRAIAVGLLYLLVWEGLLGNLVGGVRLLSVDQYALGIANADRAQPAAGLAPDAGHRGRRWSRGHRAGAGAGQPAAGVVLAEGRRGLARGSAGCPRPG